MEAKTKVYAEAGKPDILITRNFDLAIETLFSAYIEPRFIEQWMGTKVIKFQCRKHGSFQFQTTDPKGNKHGFNGAIHNIIFNQKIIRTFEMENASFGVQLEVLDFEKLTEDTSKLIKHVIYETVEYRDRNLKLPFVQGINLAHNRLQQIMTK